MIASLQSSWEQTEAAETPIFYCLGQGGFSSDRKIREYASELLKATRRPCAITGIGLPAIVVRDEPEMKGSRQLCQR
jgi:hypothetical protein